MKVVCVNDTPYTGPGISDKGYFKPNGWIKKGKIYTCLEKKEICFSLGKQIRCILAEKPNIYQPYNREVGWCAKRFVPLSYYESEFLLTESEPEKIAILTNEIKGFSHS